MAQRGIGLGFGIALGLGPLALWAAAGETAPAAGSPLHIAPWLAYAAVLGAAGLWMGTQWERMRRISATDPLTGLANRRQMMEALDREFARCSRYRDRLAVVVLDLDHFKSVNDRFGHAAGDRLLQQVARHLREGSRSSDIAGRWGGEEFLLLLPGTDTAGARLMAERLRRQVRAGTTPPITLSAGVAGYPESGTTLDQVLERADQALYAAKAQRDQVRCHGDGLMAAAPVAAMNP